MKKLKLIIPILIMGLSIAFTGNSAYADESEEESQELIEYGIRYELNDGHFIKNEKTAEVFTSESDDIELPLPQKEGYLFVGWYRDRQLTIEMPSIPKGTTLFGGYDKEGNAPTMSLYAKWEEVKKPSEKPVIRLIENPFQGIMHTFFEPYEDVVDGFEVEVCNDITFENRNRIYDHEKLTATFILRNKLGLRAYFFRARAYNLDSEGNRIYSPYSKVAYHYLVNGATEREPSIDCGTITGARIEGGSVVITAEVPERVMAFDDCYHIVELDPISGNVIRDIAKVDKDDLITASVPVGGNLMTRFGLAVKEDSNSWVRISNGYYIDNPEALSHLNIAYPTPASKKGRQGTYDYSVGDRHYFHNFYLESIIATAGSHDVAYNYNGKTYYFYNPCRLINYDKDIKTVNQTGGTVTIQVMLRYSSACLDMITPTGRTPGYNFYALNMEEAGGREHVEAAFSYLAEYWSKPNLHVDNWILGNEVNTFLNTTGRWYWAGNISRDSFMTNYSNTFRTFYYAIKGNYANARVFTCTDHTWTDRDRDWGTKGFITALDSYLNDMNPNINWNLANHAYTAVLTNSDPWNDGKVRIYSVAHSESASFVSPYNLEVLTNYCMNHFGSNCRIILSEVGFSSTPGDNPTLNGGRQSGADVQAVATAYLFYKAMFTSNIDSCIFHAGDEGEPGKNFSFGGKPSWGVYVYMDTPRYAEYCNGYLPLINGATSWESIIPGFNANTLANMPSR